MWLSLVVATVSSFAGGAYKARVSVGQAGKSGLAMALIGTLSAPAGFAAGVIFQSPAGP